jgi:serine phosphatase RsbU (regulator of sigma subunit)
MMLIGFINKGVKRKYFARTVAFTLQLFAILVVMLIFERVSYQFTGFAAREYLDTTSVVYSYLLYTYSIFSYMIVLIIIIAITMIYYHINRVSLNIVEMYYKIILFIAITFMFSYNIIDWTFYLLDIFNHHVLVLFSSVLLSCGLSILLILLLPLTKPVRFSRKEKVIKLLNASYGYTDHKKYSEFFINYLKGINQKYIIALYGTDYRVGDDFKLLSDQRLEEALSDMSANRGFINLDIELLNDTIIGKRYSDFNSKDMPHLIFPVVDNERSRRAIILFGIFPGAYWQLSLTKAILEMVEVFQGFYINMLTQNDLRQKSVILTEEKERRTHSEILVKITKEKNAQLKEKQKRISESLEYALLIQKSILPQESEMFKSFDDYFVIWNPRDIVGGDFYWSYKVPDKNEYLLAVVDCTGHGVPGALMSVSANSSLNHVVENQKIYEPAKILSALHLDILATLHQRSDKNVQDGMDLSLIRLDKTNRSISFAGAMHKVIVYDHITKKSVFMNGTKCSIGGLKGKKNVDYKQIDLVFENKTSLYLYTDGIIDQPYHRHHSKKSRRLGTKSWYQFLHEISESNFDSRKEKINKLIAEMLAFEEQRDDICILSVTI